MSHKEATSGEISATAGRVARNTVALFGARAFEYLGFFLFAIYCIRKLGVARYGVLKYATSLGGLFFIVADFGLTMMIIRDISRTPRKERPPLVGAGLSVKIPLGIFTLLAMWGITFLIQPDPFVRIVVYIFAITTVVNAFVYYYCGVFQGYEKMHLVAVVRVLYTVAICTLGIIALAGGLGLIGLAGAYMLGNVVGLVASFYLCHKTCGTYPLKMEWLQTRNLIKSALPFGLFALFGTLYLQIDNVMLFQIKGREALGIYGAATRILIAVFFFAVFFFLTTFRRLRRTSWFTVGIVNDSLSGVYSPPDVDTSSAISDVASSVCGSADSSGRTCFFISIALNDRNAVPAGMR